MENRFFTAWAIDPEVGTGDKCFRVSFEKTYRNDVVDELTFKMSLGSAIWAGVFELH